MRKLDWDKYFETAVELIAEGNVLLKNDNEALPLKKGEEVSVFGRIQRHYYKSGTGSGGMVNVPWIIDIAEGLEKEGIKLNARLEEVYREWEKENPYDLGEGWGGTPWSQKEMIPEESLVKELAEKNERAIVIIGRTAGEEQDNRKEAGSYYLTDEEKEELAVVRKYFKKVIVVLNVGNIIDMNYFLEVKADAILYAWQGGMLGGSGTARVLTGTVNPSGKLPDTIAKSIEDYPSSPNFGRNNDADFYAEDIYVGYRYFETFARDKVLYPFGFGLSYSKFEITDVKTAGYDISGAEAVSKNADDQNKKNINSCTGNNCGTDRQRESDITVTEKSADTLLSNFTFTVTVKNTGNVAGKEVVQLYVKAPDGKLGKAERVLAAYAKTGVINPGETDSVTLFVEPYLFSSYDETGITGFRSSYVLEEGVYEFYFGSDVRSAKLYYSFTQDKTVLVEKLRQTMAPVKPFERMKKVPALGVNTIVMENVPLEEYDEAERIASELPATLEITGDRGIKLKDVYDGKNTMDEFVAQLSVDELCCIVRGEGMGSPRVTAGTASAFGGVTDELAAYGIPAACCDDGPSGMRLDCGTNAFSLPNGTMIAAAFNRPLTERLFGFTGLEMTANKVECLLGPGMNIHRNPLNGRNFEYFSEDPFLSGSTAAAEINGLHSVGVTGTIKHFCGNNRETNRHFMDSCVSERALREIYLKGFEIAVKKGNADSVMTTYGKVNGLWTAGNHGLVTEILRGEWGFRGHVMTDWWANINDREKPEPDKTNFAAMVRAQNDLYMVCASSREHDDNSLKAVEEGKLTIGELQRAAKNICGFLLHSNCFRRLIGEDTEIESVNSPMNEEIANMEVSFYDVEENISIDFSGIDTKRGAVHSFALNLSQNGLYRMIITGSSNGSELAQIPLTVFSMGSPFGTYSWNGSNGKPVSYETKVPMFSKYTTFRLFFAESGLTLHSIRFELLEKYM